MYFLTTSLWYKKHMYDITDLTSKPTDMLDFVCMTKHLDFA